MLSAKRVFWVRGFQIYARDLGSHGLATKKAFDFTDAAQGNDLRIGIDCRARCPVALGACPRDGSRMI
jgi:hypothetical protein